MHDLYMIRTQTNNAKGGEQRVRGVAGMSSSYATVRAARNRNVGIRWRGGALSSLDFTAIIRSHY